MEVSAILGKIAGNARSEIAAMLRTLPKIRSERIEPAVFMSYAAMAGSMRAVLEAGCPPWMVRDLREHLPILVRSYLECVLL
ncbi:MAG TPA: hypothetical protein VEZ90_11435 [Blastocatellia bacterium]|nr:hypothetical protein [Blastocatellia bacterium]